MTQMTIIPPPTSTDEDPRGLKGLPPFVDVVYGAVLGYGIIALAQAVAKWNIHERGNVTPIFLLLITSVYLLFDYAQARMFTHNNRYKGLTRFALDVSIAVVFVMAYIAASKASTTYLIALATILVLGAWWVAVCKVEYPQLLPHSCFIILCHLGAAVVLLTIWISRFLPFPDFVKMWQKWVNLSVCVLFLAFCAVLTIITAGTRVTEVERSLLPIVPLYAPWRRITVRFRRLFNL